MQEFASQQVLNNYCCLDLFKVCKIFSIFDLVMCNITTQKNINCQKQTKDKVILLNNILINLYSNESQIYFALNNTYELLQWH